MTNEKGSFQLRSNHKTSPAVWVVFFTLILIGISSSFIGAIHPNQEAQVQAPPQVVKAADMPAKKVPAKVQSTKVPQVVNTQISQPVPQVVEVPKSWHAVTTFSGVKGKKNTGIFVVKGSQWRIKYTIDATSKSCMDSGCLFLLNVHDSRDSILLDDISNFGAKGTVNDTNNFYTPGSYYLGIGTMADSYTVSVEDYY